MPTARPQMTVRHLMQVVLSVGLFCGGMSYLRIPSQRLAAQRPLMYQQRDLTRSIIQRAKADLAATGRTLTEVRYAVDRATYTRKWSQNLEAWEHRGGARVPLIRLRISGATGYDQLEPITIETSGGALDGEWAARFSGLYREKGWRHRVIASPASKPSPPEDDDLMTWMNQ